MHAITFKQPGEPSVLMLTDVPQPIPGPEQLLVHVKACALNRADLLQRRGKYPPPPGESEILGLEIAGQVVAMGKNVVGFGIGERVFGLVGGGAYAEYCLIDQGIAIPIPEKFSYVEAAAIAEAFLTAQEAVLTLGQLNANESILIHAGASGVGSAATQIAHQANAMVYTTVGSSEKMAKIKNFGAHAILNYKETDFAAEILRLTNNRGVNVIIDFIGATYLQSHLEILQPGGRLIIVGLMGGTKTEIDLRLLQQKRLQLKGLVMRMQSIPEKRLIVKRFQETLLPLFMNGKLRPIIDSIYPFNEVQTAHNHMENNANIGKIVLDLSH